VSSIIAERSLAATNPLIHEEFIKVNDPNKEAKAAGELF
jgi:hypothetical protein